MNSLKKKRYLRISERDMENINFVVTSVLLVLAFAIGIPFIGYNVWRSVLVPVL